MENLTFTSAINFLGMQHEKLVRDVCTKTIIMRCSIHPLECITNERYAKRVYEVSIAYLGNIAPSCLRIVLNYVAIIEV